MGIVDGHERLEEPGAGKQATLRRLGLSGRARMACCARARVPLTTDCDARSVPPRVAAPLKGEPAGAVPYQPIS